ncbi:hypothetical protein BZG02_03040 [Labilibaculum filiforme]|uniref:6-phosphogluconolactonase n=1 Tax=Labilibaculum filiforme TaxID=1940526 RepID=A0A2N3I3G1_9BACT|nr:lactonase family protein [Labilibaculum filiforme]PKQ64842.1 hypothetical protein BZG02_03040 [Labilibaculum filiforme]
MIFFTGSYTQNGSPATNPQGKGIGCFQLNMESGEVNLVQYTNQRNPSYLAISEDKQYLYALEEMFESLHPQVFAYRIGEKGELDLINSQMLVGDYACHLAIIHDHLVVANYVSGNIVSYPIASDGSLSPYHQLIQHQGKGPNKVRQEAAHAHMIYPFGDHQMYVLDLCLDQAKAYNFNQVSKEWKANVDLDINIEAGAGARHMVMDKFEDYAYVLSELSGEIFVSAKKKNKFEVLQKIAFVPDNYEGEFGGAAIRLHPNGEFLYASCRGSDSIAIFKIDDEQKTLTVVAYQATEGKTPRDFTIDPSGKWLIVANQDSNKLVVFEINQETGELKSKSKITVETPVAICWFN